MQDTPVTVVIPVYKNKVHLEACLNSVLADDSDCLESIVLINDCSPESDVQKYCRSVSRNKKIRLIENEENQGFVRAVNEGMAASKHDVVLLNSDTVVSEGWLEKIIKTARDHPDAATITPFTNNGTICSYPNFCENNPLPEGLSLRELSWLISKTNAGAVCDLPTAVGFCMYIRRTAIEQVGYFDAAAYGRGYGEENDFCMRATAAGWRHLLAGDVFVFHEGGVSFGDESTELQNQAMEVLEQRYPDYRKIIADFVALDPARPLRDRIDEARLSLEGQANIVLKEAQSRFNGLSAELRVKIEAQGKTETTLAHQLQIARAFGQEQTEQLKAFEEELNSLKTYADNRATEAAEYADRIKTLEKEMGSLETYADNRATEAAEYADRIKTLEKEMGSLETYAESRATEATEYAARIKQHEATLQNLGNNVQSMAERIEQYDLRVEQYEALLAEARKAYQESEESKRELISHSSSLSKDKEQLLQEREQLLREREQLLQDNQNMRSMLTVRLQLKLLKLIGKH